jgi:hypothetical protein
MNLYSSYVFWLFIIGYSLDEDSKISGGSYVWSLMMVWHVVELRFNSMLTIFLFIL